MTFVREGGGSKLLVGMRSIWRCRWPITETSEPVSGSMLSLVVVPLCVRDTVVSVGAVKGEPTRQQLEFHLLGVDSSEELLVALVL